MGVRRDPDAWWKSMGNLNKVSSPWWLQYFLAPMPTWRWFPAFIEGIRGRGKLGAKVSGNVVPGPRRSFSLCFETAALLTRFERSHRTSQQDSGKEDASRTDVLDGDHRWMGSIV